MNQPINILALGSHLTDELGFSELNDTLGRWMAHYLAELIDKASNEPDGPIRDAAQAKVASSILAVWAHRSALPGNAYPLARYKDIIEGMKLLAPGGSPWERPTSGSRTAQAGEAHEQLRQLSIACLFADHFAEIPNIDPSVVGHLDPAERELLEFFNRWAELVKSQRQKLFDDGVLFADAASATKAPKPNELLEATVDSAIASLKKLKLELGQPRVDQ
ncbi:hypothetical protein [Limnohabitans curvus]|nr:hypothetical protein [Limnohabitans curvus]